MEEKCNDTSNSNSGEKMPRQIDADVLQSKADILKAQNFAGDGLGRSCTDPAATTTPTSEPTESTMQTKPTESSESTEDAGIIPAGSRDELNMNTPKVSDASADKSTDVVTDGYIDKSTGKPLTDALRPLGAQVVSGHVRLEQRPVDVVLIDRKTDTAAPMPDEAVTKEATMDSEVSSQEQTEKTSGVGSNARVRAVIPEFNLAERILAEQRRGVAGRRQRSTKSQDTPVMRGEGRGIGHVVSKINRGDRYCGLPGSDVQAGHFTVLSTDAEQFVMAGIVAADIARLCGRI